MSNASSGVVRFAGVDSKQTIHWVIYSTLTKRITQQGACQLRGLQRVIDLKRSEEMMSTDDFLIVPEGVDYRTSMIDDSSPGLPVVIDIPKEIIEAESLRRRGAGN